MLMYNGVRLDGTSDATPVGGIVSFPINGTIPYGYFECNGQELSKNVYKKLFSIIGNSYGEPETEGNFKLPTITDSTGELKYIIKAIQVIGESGGSGGITEIKMNGESKGTTGVVDLGTVVTSHQDISGKVNKTDIVNNLTSSDTDKPLSAAMGAALNNDLGSKTDSKDVDTAFGRVAKLKEDIEGLTAEVNQMKRMIEENIKKIAEGDDVEGRAYLKTHLEMEVKNKTAKIKQLSMQEEATINDVE